MRIKSYKFEKLKDLNVDGRDGAMASRFKGETIVTGGWNPNKVGIYKNHLVSNDVLKIENGIAEIIKESTYKTDKYNPSTDFQGRHTHITTVLDNKLHLFLGDTFGDNYFYQNDHWIYDGCRWEKQQDPPFQNRMLSFYANFKDSIYVYGGQQYQHSLKPDEEYLYNRGYRYKNGVWSEIQVNDNGMLPRGMILNNCVFKDEIVVINGGLYPTNRNDRIYFSDIWKSKDGQNFERVMEETPFSARQYHTVNEYKDRFFVISGYSHGQNLGDIWYTSDLINWYELETPPEYVIRHAQTSWVENGSLYIAFGSSSNPMNDIWKLTVYDEE